jgi:hypothetical protein
MEHLLSGHAPEAPSSNNTHWRFQLSVVRDVWLSGNI